MANEENILKNSVENIISKYIDLFLKNESKKAVSDEKSTFTYGELYKFACMIAANLSKNNVKYGDRVVIEIERSKEYVACLIGCWFLGAVTVPLSNDYPQERLDYIKKDCKYTFIIDSNFMNKIDKSLNIEPIVPNIEDPGLVIYTSGSTGNPKGVVHNFLSMSAVTSRNTAHDQTEKVEKNDIVGLIAPFTFIVGMSLILAGLGLLKHIVLVPDEIRKDPFKLAKYYDDNNIQSSFVPPRMLNFMLQNNKSLKAISVGSERITNLYLNDNPALVNGYGSTETFGGILAFHIDKLYENTPIGKPFGKEKAYVLDDNNNEVEQGELCIAGYIAIEYLNLEEESKRAFVPNPFKKIDGFDKMFRTKDIVKKLPDGNLVFVERKDWMIKINGQRVEPLEIESTIRRMKGIDAVAIKDFTGKNGITYLVAYYVCKDNITENDIREHCKSNLTSYMVPTFYIKMDELPVNPNGKLDRKNLPEPDVTNYKREYIAPKGKIEENICKAIEEVLKCGQVGSNDDFFLLGGDSIKALEIINIIDDLPIDVEMIFEGKTPKKIAELVENGGKDEIEFDRVEKESYPLTSSQLGVYFPSMSMPNSCQYNNPLTITLDKNVDVKKLVFAIEKTINNHKVYKCHIDLVNGIPSMIPYEKDFHINYKKVDNMNEELSNFVKPFNLATDDLIRINLYEDNEKLVIAFDAHHIVFDGTTLAILLKEIQNIYEDKNIYEEKTSMFDMSTYEIALKENEKYESSKKYVEELFEGIDISNDLVIDFEDKNLRTSGNVTVELDIDEEKLDKYLKSNGITENSLFLSVYLYVLAKFNGTDKSLVCIAESGRHSSMTFNTAGMLVKTIALPVDLSMHGEIFDYVRYIQTLFKNLCSNDAYPFSELANKYGINNDFMFVFQGNQFSSLKLDGKNYLVKGIPNQDAISKIVLSIFKEDKKYNLRFNYRSDLYLKEIIESFAETYIQVVNEFIKKDSFSEINLLSVRQKEELDSFNDNKIPFEEKNVVTYFSEMVKKYANKDLVVYENKHYTYGEGNKIINKIANYVHDLGLKNNDVVSVLIPRNEWIVLATYGILKAGCAYQPLDNTYPSERLSYMVKDSGAKLLITTHELASLIKNYTGKILYLEDIEKLTNENELDVNINFDDILVMLYTSGTTGMPKGVMLTHKNISSLVQVNKNKFLIDNNTVVACYASYGFDAGMNDIVSIPAIGGTLYIVNEDIRLDVAKLEEYYVENKITHACMTTQVARQFILYTKSPYLKYFMFGGETIVPFSVENVKFSVYNMYGPTEGAVYCTGFKIDKLYYRVPIGKSNVNMNTYIVDKNMNRVPIGVPGELLISGNQVSKGYLNLEEKTKETFIKNPFSNEKNYERAYRTGDIVRYLADGNIDYIGRNDGQVKIRGFRIELPEVEGVIREYKNIKDATVVAFDNVNGGKYLAGYVVSDEKINIADLKKFISSRKPAYMVPEAMLQIDKIPLNQNHKVNKKALPIITKEKANKDNLVHPISDNILVTKIKNIIKQILGSDEFDYEDDLFEYGMNSLSIVRLSALLSEELNVKADVKLLLNECSIKSIENIVINYLLENQNKDVVKNQNLRDKYLLTKTQVGIYTECLKDVDSVKYNIPVLVIYEKSKYDKLTVDILKNAIIKVVNAHPSLNSTIDSDSDGNFVMIPHYDKACDVEVLSMTNEEIENTFNTFVKPHNLSKSVYRFMIAETNDKICLFLDIHHIMFDGFSQKIFFAELDKAINGESLIQEKYSIFDVSVEEEKNRKGNAYNKAKEYWGNLLGVVEGTTTVERDNFEKNVIPATYNFIFDNTDKLSVEKLNKFVKENNITFNIFFLTAFAITLSRYTYQNDVCFTTVYNGRNTVDMNKLIGMTVKTLPFVNSFGGNQNIKEQLDINKNQILQSMNNDIYSFAEISRELNIIMDIMFVYQGKIEREPNYDMRYMALNDLKSNMEFEVRNDDEKFYCHIEYDNGKYTEKFVNGFVKAFINVCSEMLVKDNINDILLVDDIDISEMDKMNDNYLEYDERPIIYQIKDIIGKYQNKTALVFNDKHYTYKDLDDITDRLASKIISLGIKKDDVVAYLLKRNEYITICPLGIMKTGSSYQPIDSTYPSDRVNFMLKDSGAKLLILDREFENIPSDYEGKKLFIDEIEKIDAPNETTKLVTEKNDLFIMLYTSGTTGTPKGVMIDNHNISALVAVDAKARMIDNNTIQTIYASCGFDANLFETYTTLVNGGTLHIINEDMRLDFPKLEDYYIQNKITHGFMTTQMGRQFALFTKSPYLKVFGFGGEKIVPFYRKDANFVIQNYYGPTECTVYCNYFTIDKLYERVPVGKPHPNTKIYILDKNNNRLPFGAVGELAVAGHQVVKGYLNRPDKTNEVFIKNEFSTEKGFEVIYKTGDIARLLHDGNVDVIGRNDGQVKVRGFRIELTEVEEIIRRYEDIKDVTVNAYDDPNGGKYIVAYVVSDKKIEVAKLNAFIMVEKPPYMVPRITMQIDSIPLNVNGKVDKKKLPKPEITQLRNDYVAPTNDIEKEFCDLFAKILGINKVGATDDFFMLGGSSINAAQIVSYAFSKGYDLVYKNVFDYPTPRKLSEFVVKQNNIEVVETKNVKEFSGNVEPVFANNVVEKLDELVVSDIGNVLLFGATGFLGSHILKELLENTEHNIICVVRKTEDLDVKQRLKTIFEYYFERKYREKFENRVIVIDGDMLDADIEKKVKNNDFDTIINCAALVKHFANDNSIENTNTNGAINLVNLALSLNKRLVHVSTLSVAGESINDSVPSNFRFNETMLDIGQLVDNKYTKSKFDAEYEIKKAIENKKLRAKIVRVGNLMSRSTDGEFQINLKTNNFMNTIKAFRLMRCVPYDMLCHTVEFSQIDLVAKAIILLVGTNDMFNVFHVNNANTIQMNNVIVALNRNGMDIKSVSNAEFGNILNKLLNTEKDVRSINSLLAYRTNRNEKRRQIITENIFTLNLLYRLGFCWPFPDREYLTKLLEYLISFNFL